MEKQKLTKHQKLILVLAITAAVFALGIICIFVGLPLIRFASAPEQFRAWVDEHGFAGKIAYMGMVFFQVVIAIIPGEPFEIAGGYAFGAVEGTLLSFIAATLGSITVFGLVRRFGVKYVEIFFSREKLNSLRFLKTSRKRDILFLIIFMIPGTPKDLISYFAGLTNIQFPVWLVICSIGRMPSLLTSTIGGDALGEEKYIMAVVVFAITLGVSLLGLAIYNYICKRHEKKKQTDE